MKKCTKCGKNKELKKEFFRRKESSDGFRSSCKICDHAVKCKRKLIEKKVVEFIICCDCNESKSVDNFHKNIYSIYGFKKRCKACVKVVDNINRLKPKTIVSSIMCYRCKVDKNINMFRKSIKTRTGYTIHCKECLSFINNTKHFKRLRKLRKSKYREWINNIKKDIPCMDCGKVYEPSCMDYDHVRGKKLYNISRMVKNGMPESKKLSEIEKCDLVCLLCHNIRTDSRKSARKFRPCIERNFKIINKAKSTPCYICGITRELCNMQFDHINPKDKYKAISNLIGHKVETLLAEMDKCKVICALCHRIKSLSEQDDGKYSKTPALPHIS